MDSFQLNFYLQVITMKEKGGHNFEREQGDAQGRKWRKGLKMKNFLFCGINSIKTEATNWSLRWSSKGGGNVSSVVLG